MDLGQAQEVNNEYLNKFKLLGHALAGGDNLREVLDNNLQFHIRSLSNELDEYMQTLIAARAEIETIDANIADLDGQLVILRQRDDLNEQVQLNQEVALLELLLAQLQLKLQFEKLMPVTIQLITSMRQRDMLANLQSSEKVLNQPAASEGAASATQSSNQPRIFVADPQKDIVRLANRKKALYVFKRPEPYVKVEQRGYEKKTKDIASTDEVRNSIKPK